MPSTNVSIGVYKETLEHISDLFDKYSQYGHVIIAEDFNAQISKQFGSKNHLRPNDRGEILEPFIVDKDLVSINSQAWANGGTSTFVSKTGNGSLIDHMFIESRRVDCVKECSTLDDDYFNVSDHLPIRIRYRTPLLVREHAGNPYAVNLKKNVQLLN